MPGVFKGGHSGTVSHLRWDATWGHIPNFTKVSWDERIKVSYSFGDRAGEEIDESEVPLAIRKYAVTVSGDDRVTQVFCS